MPTVDYEPNDQDQPDIDEPEPKYVYIAPGSNANAMTDWLFLWDAVTGEQCSERPERLRHNLIELASANGWAIVEGPLEPEQNYPDDDPGFDPMFLM